VISFTVRDLRTVGEGVSRVEAFRVKPNLISSGFLVFWRCSFALQPDEVTEKCGKLQNS